MAEALIDERTGSAETDGNVVRVNNGDPWGALRGVRIGCVKYLNSRPLICAFDGPVTFEHPSMLAQKLAAGELDAALVPAFHALSEPGYLLVDDVAVACDGPVFSVFLAYRGELRDVRCVALDPASLSSANLLKALLAEFHGSHPAFGESGEALLLIGNQAIEFRRGEEGKSDWKFLDLGAEWKRCTGLPFVFAVWAVRAGTPNMAGVADAFRLLKERGVARIPELIRDEKFADEEIRGHYLTEYIRFGIGSGGKAALELFREMLLRQNLIAATDRPLEFI
jgi:predicted solute-binding protein